MRAGPILGALLAILVALGSLALAARLRRAGPDRVPQAPHPVLSTIGAGLLSGFILLIGFLVATGWAARITHNYPPGGLYVTALMAALAVLLYPALADLPLTWRHATAVALLAALVGATSVLALQLRG